MKIRSLIFGFFLIGQLLPARGSDRWVEKNLRRMSLKEKIGQMIFHPIAPNFVNRDSDSYAYLRFLIRDLKIGGLLLWSAPTYDTAFSLNRCQSWVKIPLLVAADMEMGAGGIVRRELFRGTLTREYMPEYISGGGVRFPPLMAIGATRSEELAYRVGMITAEEARSVGIHINFSPVMDVNNNPDNPIINYRSFGEEVELVKKLGTAYIRGTQAGGMIATAKHFPGHGDTSTDTHIELPVLPFDVKRLDTVELPPFVAAIEAGVKAIMIAHIALPAITGDRKPATLSRAILTDLLRTRLRFEGLIVTDGMVMGGITRAYDDRTAAVEAVKAGADILLFFARPDQAVEGIADAVHRGEIAESRIDESVRRILKAKKMIGLDRKKRIDPDQIEVTLGSKEHIRLAEEIADKAVTLLKNSPGLLPLGTGADCTVLKISDQFLPDEGRHFARALRETVAIRNEFYLWQESNRENFAAVLERIPSGSLIVCPAFFYVGAWKGKSAVPEEIARFLRELTMKKCRLVLVSFGSPYIFRDIPFADAYLCAYFGTRELERAAARVLLGTLRPMGKLPVTIPGYFGVGDGSGF